MCKVNQDKVIQNNMEKRLGNNTRLTYNEITHKEQI